MRSFSVTTALALGLSALILTANPATAQVPAGAVESVRVAAFGTPPGAARRPLYQRDDVYVQETLETQADGGLLVRLLDDSELRLGSNAQVKIDRFVYDPGSATGRSVTTFSRGTLRFISGKMNQRGVQIQTPAALIGIRGTDFVLAVIEAGTTIVSVNLGLVSAAPNATGVGFIVQPGEAVAITVDGSVSPVPPLAAPAVAGGTPASTESSTAGFKPQPNQESATESVDEISDGADGGDGGDGGGH